MYRTMQIRIASNRAVLAGAGVARRAMFTIGVLLALAAAARPAAAQSPRVSVVEEFTNASCDPCVAQNANFEARFLNADEMRRNTIAIVYHTRFPGRDVMNAAAPEMHDARAAYYNVTSVPRLYVDGALPSQSINGGYDGAPSDVPAIMRSLARNAGTLSPITLTIAEEHSGALSTAVVNVVGTEGVAGLTLRVVVVERYHRYANAGDNGETEFHGIARAMLPSEGTPLKLAPGVARTFRLPYVIDSAWNARETYAVAFLQRDDTGEILQAASSRGRIVLETSGPFGKRAQAPNEPLEFSGTIGAERAGMFNVSLALSDSTGWDARLWINDVPVPSPGLVRLGSPTPATFLLRAVPRAGARGKLEARVAISGDRGAHLERMFRAYADRVDVILVRRDEGDVFISRAYEAGLLLTGRRYAALDRDDEDLFAWKNHLVVYEVGRNWLEREGTAELKAFFDGGGRALVAGAEIAYALADPSNIGSGYGVHDPAFLRDYLHAGYASDGEQSSAVSGFAGDPVGGGIVYPLTTGVPNQDTPDELVPLRGAEPAFYYGMDQRRIAGIRYADGQNRLVYLGFGLEGNREPERTAILLNRCFDWLESSGTTDVPSDAGSSSATRLGRPYPMPASRLLHVPFVLPSTARVRLDLYDMQGVSLGTLADDTFHAGAGSVAYDCSPLPPGAYTLVLRADGTSEARLLIVAH